MEEWRKIAGFEGLYEVSNTGLVRSLRFGKVKILKPSNKGAGYAGIGLYRKSGEFFQTYVHTLVINAFMGGVPKGLEPNHKNGRKWDNRTENLEFVTHQENCQHRHAYLVSVTRNQNGTFKKFTHLLI